MAPKVKNAYSVARRAGGIVITCELCGTRSEPLSAADALEVAELVEGPSIFARRSFGKCSKISGRYVNMRVEWLRLARMLRASVFLLERAA